MAARIVLVALLMDGLVSNYFYYLLFLSKNHIVYLSNMWMIRVLAMIVISVRRGKTTP